MLTKDHTLDRDKIDATLAPDLYRRAPNILTQKVGSILLLKPDTGSVELEPNDIVLACTDGLSDRVKSELMLEYAAKFESNLESYADVLLDRALDCGGQDNISFILAQVKS
jgi:protein phosphatase